VQFGRGAGGRGEDVSVLGHQTQAVLQEAVERVAQFLFLRTDVHQRTPGASAARGSYAE